MAKIWRGTGKPLLLYPSLSQKVPACSGGLLVLARKKPKHVSFQGRHNFNFFLLPLNFSRNDHSLPHLWKMFSASSETHKSIQSMPDNWHSHSII
jgi:hypothetical protein